MSHDMVLRKSNTENEGHRSELEEFSDTSNLNKPKEVGEEHTKLIESFIEKSIDGVALVDEEGRFIEWNTSMEAISGYRREEIIGRYLWDVQTMLSTENQRTIISTEALKNEVTEALKTGKGEFFGRGFEAEFRRPDGGIRWIYQSVFTIKTAKGYCIGTIVRDITEPKKASEALQRSEQMLRIVLDNFPGTVYWKDSDLVYLGANRESARVVGFDDSSQFVGKTDFDMPWAKTEGEAYRADDREVMESGRPKLHIVESQMRADGSIGWLDTSKVPLRDAEGKVIGVLGTSTDITQRKRAEEALERSEEKFSKAFHGTVAAKAIVRMCDGVVVDVNDSWLRLLGLTRGEAIGRSILYLNIWHNPSDREEFIGELIEKGFVHDKEFKFCHKDGRGRIAQVSAQILELGGEKVILDTLIDITERKRVEEELARSNADLQQFAYIVSHDLKQPLTVISSYLDLLQERYKGEGTDEKAEMYIQKAMNSSKRMDEMIDSLLIFSRVSREEAPYQSTDMNQVMDEVKENLASQIRESKATVTHDELPIINAVPQQMVHVLQNLVSNGIKFHGDEAPRIHVSAIRKKGFWQFSIRDNGIGINPKNQDKLFKMFSRLHSQQEYKGTGIGLATVRKIVERYKGKVWVESEEGKGSTFFFTISKIKH